MRKGLLVLALCLWASVAHAQLTLVQYKLDPDANPWNTDASEVITPDSTMTAGNTVVVGFTTAASNRTVSSVVCGGESLSLAATTEVSGAHEMWFYAVILASNQTSCTVTVSSAMASGGNVFLWEISGAHAVDSIGGSSTGAVSSPSTSGHSSGTVTAQGASSFYVGAVYGSTTTAPGWVKDADYTSNTQSTTLATAYRSTTGNDSFDSTTGNGGADTETSVNILVEVLPGAGGGGGAKQNQLFGGLGR